MNPEDLTIEMLEECLGQPASEWHGKCSQLAHATISILGHGHYAYGHYYGKIDPKGYWSHRGIARHGWVLLGDGRILDPTRWSFENVDPYIYIGPNGTDYDEGGNALRGFMRTPCPSADDEKAIGLKEVMESRYFFEELTKTPFEEITQSQAMWVANAPYDELGIAVAPIYRTLIENKMEAFIPVDNYNRALREGRIRQDGE